MRISLIRYKVIGRHKKWVTHCTVTESISDCGRYRKFIATIHGWRGFEIYCGVLYEGLTEKIIAKVSQIRDTIEAGDIKEFYRDCRIS